MRSILASCGTWKIIIIIFFPLVHNTSLLADLGQEPSLLDRLQDPADKKSGLTLKTMGEWESRLPEQSFARIHRSAIVNLEAVESVEEWFNYSFRVYLTGVEEPFVMSRRQATKLKGKMG